jgi:hypothetical protein
MMAPDPTGAINGNVRTRSDVFDRSTGVAGHELQHLVNASRRLRVLNFQNWNETFWLNEGLSHIAEELLFYAASARSSGGNITIDILRGSNSLLNSFNRFGIENFHRFSDHLRDPTDASPISGDDLATRGAIWAFLRYAADRHPSDEPTFWRSFIEHNGTGFANLANAVGDDALSWLHDWNVSLYTDDLLTVAERFHQPSWHYRSIMPALNSNGGVYPLGSSTLGVGVGGQLRLDIIAGGAAIVRFGVQPGSRAEVETTVGGVAPPSTLRMTIMRIR